MIEHEIYMKRCLQLAKNGLGTTYPNPLVGSVVVYEGKIIGEGWHKKAGEPHAEVNAINSVKDKSLLKKSTIYVNLEPCSHFGKTPPCANLIIEHQIPKVVIGCIDSFSEVAGKGIEKLTNAGCEVILNVLEKECLAINKRFFTFHNKKRPYIILKWAESADGFIAPLEKETKTSIAISNVYSRQLVHKYRSEEQAILVGTHTVLEDNPSLDTRDWFGSNPIRIILDKSGKISDDYQIKNKKNPTIIFTEQENCLNSENCIYENLTFDKNLIFNIMDFLFEKGIQSIIIEGGTQTLQHFIDDNLWDEARVFISENELVTGIKKPVFSEKCNQKHLIEKNQLKIYSNHD
ncbi:bifunctional diaminohydroxyphosphoribosylaminopyrimidine deaminase/5-amino-6-(5-phosphoribosylamino)uracil reductase RibD [Flavobacterium urocaniciphilum]|uniref:Riboflavin biosynthesis protein RibD n=1 Tax=Flavobacterium urocaniciphilum TaxID=1299341 RepID=A0A1H8YS51_9FLAO|nr:bifunctional diaminohydroxyphosphoribosylaminopyrimidine deaminase/5-amino-6-(5-phosphoribosylamino)uracil reductase RibD [Flavobacterium urocaniciphilum]SEP54996.1 diaminohydroxyphosphoribosylaminopyrimidine deaminase [Flavobacterium urocaniciphilum]